MDCISGFQFGIMTMYAGDGMLVMVAGGGDLSSDSSSRSLLRLSQTAVSPRGLGW
jgi:hypothetical protein